jgi:S-formylglutathione hydrolase FrmB
VRATRTSTRRRLLAGAAGAAAVGAGAVWADRSGEAARVWHHFAGGCAGPDGAVPPAPAQDPVSGRFRSRHVHDDDVGFMVWQPGELSASGGLPVLVVLPGRGSSARVAFDDLHLHAFLAAELARRGAAAGLAAVDGGESYWHARPDGEDRMAMLETEFLPLLEREFGLGGPGRAIAGWSMGGYGALLAPERDPTGWAGVAVASPAIWPAYSDVWVSDAFDGREDFEEHDVFAGSPALERIPVWIGCGTSDPFYENSRRLAALLPGARTDWADGGHDQCLWRLVAPPQMAAAVSSLRA